MIYRFRVKDMIVVSGQLVDVSYQFVDVSYPDTGYGLTFDEFLRVS